MRKKVVLMLDGAFVKIKLRRLLGKPADATDIEDFCQSIMNEKILGDQELLRVFFYDAPPFEGSARNPIDGTPLSFAETAVARQNRALLAALELLPYFAVRRGVLMHSGWKLGNQAIKNLGKTKRPIEPSDLVPNISQKGVDMRIGLDIAWIALKRIADVLVLVTGDSDFIPAMKMARKEGLTVVLKSMGHPVFKELKVHADVLL